MIAVAHDTGRVVWPIGTDIATQLQTPVERGTGHVAMFDNGNLRQGNSVQYCRAIEGDPATVTMARSTTVSVRLERIIWAPYLAARAGGGIAPERQSAGFKKPEGLLPLMSLFQKPTLERGGI